MTVPINLNQSIPPPAFPSLPPSPVPQSPPAPSTGSGVSAWEHASAVVGGLVGIVFAAVDFYLGQHVSDSGSLLTQAGDAALVITSFGLLGVKSAGVLPRS